MARSNILRVRAMKAEGGVFLVPFQGEILACESGLDAVAVKRADSILIGREDASPTDLHRLATVMERYDRPIAAQRLRSEQMRLVAFSNSIGA
jgi:hypothetical protein